MKPNQRMVYKVLSPRRESVISMWAVLKEDNKHIFKYLFNKTVKPKIGKIFVFDNIKNAANYKDSLMKLNSILKNCKQPLKIVKAIATNPKKTNKCAGFYGLALSKSIVGFWKALNGPIISTPKGTLICDSLKCLE